MPQNKNTKPSMPELTQQGGLNGLSKARGGFVSLVGAV